MTNNQEFKIQKALIPAGAGIIAIGAVIKILAIAVVGAFLIILGIRKIGHGKKEKAEGDE